MPNARAIKKRIQSVKSTGKITQTMQMVSTVKSTRAVQVIRQSRPYQDHLKSLLALLGGVELPLTRQNTNSDKRVLILVTSNRGLCGGFNANLTKTVRQMLQPNDELHVFGKKGIQALRFAGIEPAKISTEDFGNPSMEFVRSVANPLMERYAKGEIASVEAVFMKFHSMGRQEIVREQLLPVSVKDGMMERISGFEPLYEPDRETLVGELVPKVARIEFYRVFLDSTASEHIARKVAMKAATDASEEMVKSLTMSYNRARQSAITTEISEIVGGADALQQ